jgi:NAD(P)-dependent dehydrogenase (short-subunit alcohol dehydrogenase family)
MDLNLTGKTALVTGSTAGIGLAIAERLAAEGVDVVISGRNQAKLDEAAAKVAAVAANGGKVRAVLADPATAQGAETLIAAAPEADILVNNLGIYEAKPFTEISDADWHHFFEVNVVSGARLARHYFPKMLAKDWGRVIFIASESALVIPGEMIHYGMTKTAQLAIARGLAEQTRGTGVTVNSVLPGPTRSEGIVEFIRSVVDNKDAPESEREAEFFTKLRPLSLIRRLIEADEIAAQVALLASPLGAITNGAAVRVEGGIVPTIA